MRFYSRRRRMPTVIIVSLIDIFVILLIFVIVTTTFKTDEKKPQVVITLPKTNAGAVGDAPTEPIKLTVDKDDKMYLDGNEITVDGLKPALEKIITDTPNRPLALNADTKASFGFIINILGILKDAGVKNIPAFTEKE